MPGGSSERRRRKIVLLSSISLVILYFLKTTLPHQSIHYATYYKNYTQGIQNYLIPVAPLVATVLPDDNVGPTKAIENHHPHQTPHSKSESQRGSNAITQVSPYDISVSKKVAVIVENRMQKKLIPLILHFASVLGPEWPIIIYTSTESLGMFSASVAFNRFRKSGRIQIRLLPITVLFTNSNSVNAFFTKPWIWHQLAPAEHLLLFQADSMLCANAARSVDDFLKYDFIGAPIDENLGRGYDGGLSLRRRSLMEAITREWEWDGARFEDQWFFDRMLEMQERGDKIVLPSMEIARTFSVQTIDFPHPLGVHQVHRWIEEGMVSLDEWCPEYKLCSEEQAIDT